MELCRNGVKIELQFTATIKALPPVNVVEWCKTIKETLYMRRRVESKEYNWYAIPEYCRFNGSVLTIFLLIICICLGDFFCDKMSVATW